MGKKKIEEKKEATELKRILEQEKLEQEILKNKNLLLEILKEAKVEGIVGEENTLLALINKIMLRLVKNAEPTSSNLIVSDESGSGKDYIVKRICKILVPKESYFHRTDLSPNVLKYWHAGKDDFTWDYKVIHYEDPKDDALKNQTLKVMASGGNKSTIVVDGKAKDFIIRGKPVIIVTSLKATIDDEGGRRWDNTRMDLTSKQTEIIKQKILERETGLIENNPNEALRHALQYLILPKEVIIPFAQELRDLLPSTLIIRTQIKKLLDYIKSSAVLHQYNREKDEQGRVIANWFDYDYARFVFLHLKDEVGVAFNKDEEEFIDTLRKAGGPLSVRETADRYDRHGSSWIYNHIDDFKSKGMIREVTEWDADANKKILKIYATEEYECQALSTSSWFNTSSTTVEEDQNREGFPVLLDFSEICTGVNELRKEDDLPILFTEFQKNQENLFGYGDLQGENGFPEDEDKTKENQEKPQFEQIQEVLDYCFDLDGKGHVITYENLVFNFKEELIDYLLQNGDLIKNSKGHIVVNQGNRE